MQLAKAIHNGQYRIITTGLNCAMEFSALEDASILMLGGSVNKNSYCVNGSLASQILDDMSFHIAFLDGSGFTPSRGFSTSVIEESGLAGIHIMSPKHTKEKFSSQSRCHHPVRSGHSSPSGRHRLWSFWNSPEPLRRSSLHPADNGCTYHSPGAGSHTRSL